MNKVNILFIFILLEQHSYQSCFDYPEDQCPSYLAEGMNRFVICEKQSSSCVQIVEVHECNSMKDIIEGKTKFYRDMCEYFKGSYPCEYNSETKKCNSIYSCEEAKNVATCSEFKYCEPGGTGCRINKCMDITRLEDCKLKTFDAKTIIKCKWENNDCLHDEEITTCEQAKNLTEISNETMFNISNIK